MKKRLIGIFLLILAAWLLLQGNFGIPMIRLEVWSTLGILFFAGLALKQFFEGEWVGGFILAGLSFLITNNTYHLVEIGTGYLFLAFLLGGFGMSMIFKPRRLKHWQKKVSKDAETAFGNSIRYINDTDFKHDSAEVAFGNVEIYFDNAEITGDSATFDVEVGFGNMTLYVPKTWRVELDVEVGFGSAKQPKPEGATEKTLIVTGDVGFGRLSIVYI